MVRVVVDAVGRDRIRGPLHQEGILLGGVLGDVDAGEQLHAVAHGDAEIELGVVRARVFGLLAGFIGGAGLGEKPQNYGGEEKGLSHLDTISP